jgi:hypothetical protein
MFSAHDPGKCGTGPLRSRNSNGLAANAFLDIAQVHVAYFRGQTQTGTYDIATGL